MVVLNCHAYEGTAISTKYDDNMSDENPEIGQSIDVHGIKTNYHRRGSGAPLLLLHGGGPGLSAGVTWRLILPELVNDFDVVAPDLVGFGYTDRPEGFQYNLASWRDHLVGFTEALGLDTFSVVGFSLGAALATSIAVHHPERIDRLILMSAAGVSFPLTEGAEVVLGYQPSLENMQKVMKTITWNEEIGNNKALAEMRYKASIRPGVYEAFAAMFPAPRQNSLDDLATPEDQIGQITAPTLIVHGRDDQVTPLENSYRFHQLIGNSQLHVYGQCGHLTPIEKASEFTQLLTNFLR